MLQTNSESSLLPLSPVLSVYQLFALSSNVAIITGGSRGLGKEMASAKLGLPW